MNLDKGLLSSQHDNQPYAENSSIRNLDFFPAQYYTAKLKADNHESKEDVADWCCSDRSAATRFKLLQTNK